VVYRQSALPHHLLQIPIRELVSAIPPDVQQDDRRLELAPLEGGLRMLQEYDSRRVIEEPEENNSSKAIPATEPN
jgi:hypothetical protein